MNRTGESMQRGVQQSSGGERRQHGSLKVMINVIPHRPSFVIQRGDVGAVEGKRGKALQWRGEESRGEERT